MTPHKVVVTAKTGPDRAVVEADLLNVENIEIDLVGKRLLVEVDQSVTGAAPVAGNAGDNIKEFDLAGVTDITIAIVAGAYTVTVT